jgi:23S rRNA (pseudouridine1915-N3)-methyltransferase
MKLCIHAAGRLRSGPEKELYEAYAARLAAPSSALGPLTLIEFDERRSKTAFEAAISAQKAGATRLVALDERGRDLTSRRLAEELQRWRDAGIRECHFVIGAADGLPDAIRASADLSLSLGRLTYPHLLARVLLAEQLYRAASLIAGHPYHRE